jgi:2-polyprenyl-3-methyl-5-hydroxy-6-metoxy-1,4-benzoquinol methylase
VRRPAALARDGTFDWVCSSHLIEHFPDAEAHAAELARVLSPRGQAFVITPNAPADFENPFHIRLFRRSELAAVLEPLLRGGLGRRHRRRAPGEGELPAAAGEGRPRC